jgi:mono/diheme cytochrome c family protein
VSPKLLLAGGVAILSVAIVSGQAGQAPSSQPARPRAAQPSNPAPVPASARPQATAPTVTPAAAAATTDAHRALLKQYCVTCHNARLKTANLVLEDLDLSNLSAHAEMAE